MKNCIKTEWYIDYAALPYDIFWARLRSYSDKSEDILTYDGKLFQFPQKFKINNMEYIETGRSWLSQEEYSLYEYLLEDGEIDKTVIPPYDENIELLLTKMHIKLKY